MSANSATIQGGGGATYRRRYWCNSPTSCLVVLVQTPLKWVDGHQVRFHRRQRIHRLHPDNHGRVGPKGCLVHCQLQCCQRNFHAGVIAASDTGFTAESTYGLPQFDFPRNSYCTCRTDRCSCIH